MGVIVTGGSGFLGRVLVARLKSQGITCYQISRHTEGIEGALAGDVLQPDLGLTPDAIKKLGDVSAVYHLAGIVNLSQHDRNGRIWETNVEGTRNVIEFCLNHKIPHLYHTSTAYTLGRSPYELSKAKAEELVKTSRIPQITIFKPSIVIGTADHFSLEHFPQFVATIIKLHRSADKIRRYLQSELRLPPLSPLFRIKGDPDAHINLVSVDSVVEAMADIKSLGTFWLTNPSPPKVGDLASWLSEYLLLDVSIVPDFKPSLVESAFARMMKAFEPYIFGDSFPSDLDNCLPIDESFIEMTVRKIVGL